LHIRTSHRQIPSLGLDSYDTGLAQGVDLFKDTILPFLVLAARVAKKGQAFALEERPNAKVAKNIFG